MPDQATTPAAAQPGQTQPQQAPFGVSSITGPTPNRGYEAAAQQRVGALVNQMMDIVKLTGVSSELGQALLKAVTGLSKHVPPGTVSNAQERNALEKAQLQNRENGAMQQQLRQMGQQGQGAAPGGAGQMPMMRAAA